MCLSFIFKEACIKEYGNCKTAKGKCLPKPVRDEYIATIKVLNGNCVFGVNAVYSEKKARPKDKVKRIKTEGREVICIILESPHKDEYNEDRPLGPAMSKTGKNISSNFINMLNSAIKNGVISILDGDYSLLLINAVSYQCSNARALNKNKNSKKRDSVFLSVWGQGGKKNFLKRVKKYKPVLIVNSCTGGINNIKNPAFLNGKVNEALDELPIKTERTYSAHPSSSWFWRKGLKK